jgi:hypothetical protein
MLYTAIGQLATHAENGSNDVHKILVTLADESIPQDFSQAIGKGRRRTSALSFERNWSAKNSRT